MREAHALNPSTNRVVTTLLKAADLETHVRVTQVENVRVLELRDYIPSLGEYGRGYWIPMTKEAVFGLMNGLTEIANSEDLA